MSPSPPSAPVPAGLSRIIVPTVYREDYLLPLKSLTNNHDPVPYLRAMARIQAWTAAFDYIRPRHEVEAIHKACNAFEDEVDKFRLIFPEAIRDGEQAR